VKYKYKLCNVLKEAGLSRQAFFQHNISLSEDNLVHDWVIDSILEKRKKHPVIGLKKIFIELENSPIGRDKFIAIACKLNLNISLPKSYTRTTFSFKGNRYLNLLADKVFNDINQLWVTDITYIRLGDVFGYLAMVMDVYSRRIIGYAVSLSLKATLCVEALQMALKTRGNSCFNHNLIHHSDKGVQYIFEGYTKLLEQYGIQISMCNSAYENSHMERLNGIIKNEYIIPFKINTFEHLQKKLPKIINYYNDERPHSELKMSYPKKFELSLKDLPKCQRTILKIFVDKQTRDFQDSIAT
jgi:putative transposase